MHAVRQVLEASIGAGSACFVGDHTSVRRECYSVWYIEIGMVEQSDGAKLGPFPVGAHSMSSAFKRDFYVEDPDGYIICFGGRPMVG